MKNKTSTTKQKNTVYAILEDKISSIFVFRMRITKFNGKIIEFFMSELILYLK